MKIRWTITATDVRRVRSFVTEHRENAFVREREKRNLASRKPVVRREKVWPRIVGCLLTTQQRSGPGSAIFGFMSKRPFPLRYRVCRSHRRVEQLCRRELESHGGIRRAPTISRQAAANLDRLEGGLWKPLIRRLNGLRAPSTTAAMEREVADFVEEHLDGFGPKQARNLLQWLGLSRFEIPLDSRITKWLNAFGFPVVLSATGLADRSYYRFVSDGLQQLCVRSDVYPCILDAAIFASFDGAWTSREARRVEGLEGA